MKPSWRRVAGAACRLYNAGGRHWLDQPPRRCTDARVGGVEDDARDYGGVMHDERGGIVLKGVVQPARLVESVYVGGFSEEGALCTGKITSPFFRVPCIGENQ